MNFKLKDWQIKISEHFEKNKLLNAHSQWWCGIFGKEEDWKKFIDENRDMIIRISRDELRLRNGECWFYYNYLDSPKARGKKFGRVKVNIDTPKDIVYMHIIPICMYCQKWEWIK